MTESQVIGNRQPANTIMELVAGHALQQPTAAAIDGEDRSPLSYAELAQLMDKIGDQLRTWGIAATDRIAIVLPNGPEMATCFLSVAAFATAAPLNPVYHRSEFDFYLDDLQAKALVIASGIQSPARDAADAAGIAIIELQPSQQRAGAFALELSGAAARPNASARPTASAHPIAEAALVLHTSGTTARPKIVPLSQANLCRSARNIAQSLRLSPTDRCFNVMPLFHIHGLVGALLSTLDAGGTVVCSNGFDAARFFDLLRTKQPTWYTAVPTMHQAVLTQWDCSQTGGDDGVGVANTLRFIRSCSSPLPPTVMHRLQETFAVPVVEAYGMTEAAHQMSCNPLPPAVRKPGSVGVPTGVEVAIMDAAGYLQAAGVEGEVVIRGANVTSGYENNDTANAAAFTDGWFRTGDRGRVDNDGYLFLTGRIKELINRGGEKISPREIDEVLLMHPGIAEAMAFAMPHPSLGEQVAAAVVVRDAGTLTAANVQEFTATKLADFKIPQHVVFVAELPKGPTGKPQRVGLADKLGIGAEPSSKGEPNSGLETPLSDTERGLAEIWSELLGNANYRRDDQFFFCGGDSLSAALLVAMIEKRFHVALPMRDVFACESLAEMATAIDRQPPLKSQTTQQFESIVPFQTSGQRPPFFMVHGHSGRAIGLGMIAPYFDSDQPYYGFVARGMDGSRLPHREIKEMATSYVKQMCAIQPEGPYYVGGFCSGGMVAYEIAQQLQTAGQTVALLALLDTAHPSLHVPPSRWVQATRSMKLYVRRAWMSALLATDRTASIKLGERIVNETLRRGARLYQPAPYAGRITLIRSEKHFRTTEPYMGWLGTSSEGVELRQISGDHSVMLTREHIGPAARQLQQCLREAQATWSRAQSQSPPITQPVDLMVRQASSVSLAQL